MIERIVEKDLDNCYKELKENEEIQKYEKELYSILEGLDSEISMQIEEIFSGYTSKAVRIGYVQGIKDFNEMFIDIKGDVNEIIEKVEEGL